MENITVYGAYWCPDCRRSKQFLGEHQIQYSWVDIEQDKEGEQTVLEMNDGKRIIPTIVFGDGSFLVEPSNADLAEKLGLKTKASRDHYDLLVVGAGPAGLTAALYAAREGLDALVIERAAVGGQAAGTEKLDNMPGFPDSVTGAELSARLRSQAEKFGVEILQAQDVVGLKANDRYRCVKTAGEDEYSGDAVLIATGSRYKRLGAKGESDYLGAGVHFCATCDGPFYKGKNVVVVGGGNSATEESLLLVRFADRVTILVRKDSFSASPIIQEQVLSHPQIDVMWNTEVREFLGKDSHLNGIRIENNKTNEESVLETDGAFIFIGLTPNTSFLKDSDVHLDRWGFVVTGHQLTHTDGGVSRGHEPAVLETSLPGVFAAGDVRAESTKQVASATGEGATAALLIREYLKTI